MNYLNKENESALKKVLCDIERVKNENGEIDYTSNRKDSAEAVIIAFSHAVNNFGFDDKAFINAFCKEHKTLQQNMFRAMLGLIKHMASDDYNYDGRNEASHKVAKEIVDKVKVLTVPMI